MLFRSVSQSRYGGSTKRPNEFMTPVLDENGNKLTQKFGNICWFTNIEHGRHHEPLKLMTMADNLSYSKQATIRENGYQKYDNANAIEVPFVDAIPSDFNGLMGVPITFLDKYNPDQFEIIKFRKGDDDKDLKINGKALYCRILIKHRNPVHA